MRTWAALFIVMALVVSAGTAGAELVVNGGFETGNLSGWTLGGTTTYALSSRIAVGVDTIPYTGNYAAYFANAGGDAFLRQTLATTPGVDYNLSFWLSNTGGSPSHFAVSWGGTTLLDLTNFATSYPDYTLYSISNLAAATSSTVLQFALRQDSGSLHLDDVYVGTPEPGTLVLLAAGVIGFGAARTWGKRRRQV